MLILCIETANAITSVAISQNGNCIAVKTITESNKAADILHLLIQDLLEKYNISFTQLNAIAISAGPGSYTGLRIATAAAKGFCTALNIPLIAIPTLQAMVFGIKNRYNQSDFDAYIPMIDARRMEVFTGIYNSNFEIIKQDFNLILENDWFNIVEKEKKYCLFGNGANKAANTINVATIILFEKFVPSAEDLCLLAFQRYSENKIEDIAYFEPNYIKPFYSTKQI